MQVSADPFLSHRKQKNETALLYRLFDGQALQSTLGYQFGNWSTHVLFELVDVSSTFDGSTTSLKEPSFGTGAAYHYLKYFSAGPELSFFNRDFSGAQTNAFSGETLSIFIQARHPFTEIFSTFIKFKTSIYTSTEQKSDPSIKLESQGHSLFFGLEARP